MHPEIEKAQREIADGFNNKPKSGIEKIKKICTENNLAVEHEIADFFHQQKNNLDLEAVGDYLSGPEEENKKVLSAFTKQINFEGQSFVEGLRTYLRAFKLPGEAQKIDRLVERFSEAYTAQNPGAIANQDAAYLLAYQTIMLNTDLHNPSVANKMTLDGLNRNLRGQNDGGNFEPEFLEGIYNEIKNKPFELNFVKASPGYELTSTTLKNDSTFKRLDSALKSSNIDVKAIFPKMDNVMVDVDKPKSWLNDLTGYNGTMTLTDSQTAGQVTVQVYTPNIFSKWLFGEQPKVIIEPAKGKESIDLAAKVAASFTSPVKNVKATYDNELGDLISAYDEQKQAVNMEKSRAYSQSVREQRATAVSNAEEANYEDGDDYDSSVAARAGMS